MEPMKCIVCNSNTSIRRCNGCKSATYCSSSCQESDWKYHKFLCSQYNSFKSSPRPSAAAKLTIELPPFAKKPHFIWIEEVQRSFGGVSLIRKVEQGSTADNPKYSQPLGVNSRGEFDDPQQGRFGIYADYDKEFHFDHTTWLYYRDAYNFDGSPANMCMINITGGEVINCWGGPLVVVSQPGCYHDNTSEYQDVTMADFKAAGSCFRKYGKKKVDRSNTDCDE